MSSSHRIHALGHLEAAREAQHALDAERRRPPVDQDRAKLVELQSSIHFAIQCAKVEAHLAAVDALERFALVAERHG